MNDTAADRPTLAGRVTAEQIRMVYRHLPAPIVPTILAAALIAYLFRDHVADGRLWLWVAWVASSYLLFPSWLYAVYRRSEDCAADAACWGRRYALMAVVTASSWGAGGFLLFVPDSPLYQIFLGSVMFTSAVSVLAATFPYTPAFYAAAIPILAPLATRYVAEGGLVQLAMAGVITAVFFMLAFFQRGLSQSLAQAIALRHERELLIAELERKNNEVEAASRAKTRFLAAASHDLRQPLHAQRLFLAELEAQLREPGALDVMAHIRHAMESMDALLAELLEIVRLDAGAVEVRPCAFPLRPLLDTIEREFAGQVAQKGLRYRVSRCEQVVYSDPALLERILRNLVHNAVRYTVSGAVLVACRRRGPALEIQVRDSGPGIPVEQQAAIFEEFVQLANPERNRNKGLGLGLAIVARLAGLLGHALELRSQPGAGSTFKLRVPLAQHSTVAAPTCSRTDAYSDLHGLRVWVVDDDSEILQAMALLLERWGCEARCMADAGQAHDCMGANAAPPDCVIADYRLPDGRSGVELIRRIREYAGDRLLAVLITGDASAAVLEEARAADCILLHKPVAAQVLYELLRNMRSTAPAAHVLQAFEAGIKPN